MKKTAVHAVLTNWWTLFRY